MKQILLFTAPWCEPCKAMKPALRALIEDYDNIKYEEIDVSENQAAARKYKVMGVPTIIVLVDGEVTGRATGSQTRDRLVKLIEGQE